MSNSGPGSVTERVGHRALGMDGDQATGTRRTPGRSAAHRTARLSEATGPSATSSSLVASKPSVPAPHRRHVSPTLDALASRNGWPPRPDTAMLRARFHGTEERLSVATRIALLSAVDVGDQSHDQENHATGDRKSAPRKFDERSRTDETTPITNRRIGTRTYRRRIASDRTDAPTTITAPQRVALDACAGQAWAVDCAPRSAAARPSKMP